LVPDPAEGAVERLPCVQPPAPSDALLAACCAGDREAFAQLFDLCRDRVYSLAWHLCGDRAAAADITQDVFMKLLVRLPQFRRQSAFSTWLYRIAVNTALDHRRRWRRTAALDELPAEPVSAAVENGYARAERRSRIRAALLTLPAKLRAPIVLRHVEGLSYDEIAAAIGVSAGTVASRLSRAHARLARELADLR
jgi:RNA polymerase sigma-70 factor (ECF subfamily)